MTDYDAARAALRTALGVDGAFDLLERQVQIGGRRAVFYLLDGFVKDDLFEKILEAFFKLAADDAAFTDVDTFLTNAVPYCEAAPERSTDKVVTAVLSGQTALLIEGFAQVLLLDIRTYPQRDTAEPEKDKVFRGSHDGFVETMILNCALVRRRIRSPTLRMEALSIGSRSQTDVVLCYLHGKADAKLVAQVRARLQALTTPSLTMNAESLAELLLPQHWYDPFPRFQYTERPDAAAAQVLEGDILLIVDNSPAVMVLPCTLFHLMEEANDYYFPPLTGTYLRLTRFFVLLLMLLLTPLWLHACLHPEVLPRALLFLLPREPGAVPLLVQLLLLELGIDGLKLATLNTPNMLTTSLSVIAGIVVGDFAVQSGWFCAETLLYMAFVALGGYNQPSMELSYSIKFSRIFLLLLTAAAGLWGLLGGLLLLLLLLLRHPTIQGHGYLYPLLPFSGRALAHLLFRPSAAQK